MEKLILANFALSSPYEDVLYLQYSRSGNFKDDPTLYCRKEKSPGPKDLEIKRAGVPYEIDFGGYQVWFAVGNGKMPNLTVTKQGNEIYKFSEIKNSGELPFPSKTPDVFGLVDNPKIYMPSHGYTAVGGGKYNGVEIDEDSYDLYLIFAHGDFRRLRKAYIKITGRTPMVPYSALGAWDSKYFEYDDKSIQEEIDLYARYGLPLDNFVIDTDWRINDNNGAGYNVNTKDFPDIRQTFAMLHSQNLRIMFNDHPEPVPGADNVFDPIEVEFRQSNLTRLLEDGLDYWWYDRNWWTRLKSPVSSLTPETCGFYLYNDIAWRFNKNHQAGDYPARTMMMGNVDQIRNGLYEGISNSASHRYQIQWTGDTYMSGKSLSQEFANMLKGGNNLITYINSDISGHMGDGDDNLYIRWLEYGALSPIFRLHSTKGQKRYRQPWLYGNRALKEARKLYALRYSLLPLFYSLAHKSFEEGLPLVSSPDYFGAGISSLKEPAAMLGDSLAYAVPIPDDKIEPLKKANVPGGFRVDYFLNRNCRGKPFLSKCQSKIDFSAKPGESLDPGVLPDTDYSFIARGTLVGDSTDKRLVVGSDDGIKVYLDGKLVISSWLERAFALDQGPLIEKGSTHELVIKYFQGGGGASLAVGLQNANEGKDACAFYLPKGRWLGLFDGDSVRVNGRQSLVSGNYGFGVFPLYVREGSVIVKAKATERTDYQNYDTLYVDLFPSIEHDGRFELYEDDRNTEAYMDGFFRKTDFCLKVSEDKAVLSISAAVGKGYAGDDAFSQRNIVVRFHCINGFKPKTVLYAGEEVPTQFMRKSKKAFPLSNEGPAPDSPIVQAKITIGTSNAGELSFLFGERKV